MKTTASVLGLVIAVGTVWALVGFPRVALSTDIERLDRSQADQAVEVYQNKVRSLLTIPAPDNPMQNRVWQEELSKAKRELGAAENRKIELAK